MANIYYNSDYARNKDKDSIIYKSVTGEVTEITPIDYLKENPDKSFNDFLELKKYSDDNYHNEMLKDKKEIRNTLQIVDLDSNSLIDNTNPLDLLCDLQEYSDFNKVFNSFLTDGGATETEVRRFIMSYYNNLSCVEIAQKEKVKPKRVYKSITNFKNKAKFFLELGGKTY